MNVLKNFEAVFVVAVVVATGSSYFVQSAEASANPAASVKTASVMSVATPSRMAVVTVVGKRMNALEKQRSLEDDRRLAKSGAANGNRS